MTQNISNSNVVESPHIDVIDRKARSCLIVTQYSRPLIVISRNSIINGPYKFALIFVNITQAR